MSNPQPSAELTTRDVLQQIDHRLSLIEMDVRENSTKLESKIDALEAKTESKIDALEAKTESKIDALEAKTEAKFDALRAEFTDRIDALDHKVEGRIDALDHKVEGKIDDLDNKIEVEIREIRRDFNGKFNLVIGLVNHHLAVDGQKASPARRANLQIFFNVAQCALLHQFHLDRSTSAKSAPTRATSVRIVHSAESLGTNTWKPCRSWR